MPLESVQHCLISNVVANKQLSPGIHTSLLGNLQREIKEQASILAVDGVAFLAEDAAIYNYGETGVPSLIQALTPEELAFSDAIAFLALNTLLGQSADEFLLNATTNTGSGLQQRSIVDFSLDWTTVASLKASCHAHL